MLPPVQGIRFYRKKDGTIQPRKIGLDANRVKTDPAFFVTLTNALAFGVAAVWAGRVFRLLKPFVAMHKLKAVHKKLLGHLMTGLTAAATASDEHAQRLLKGFQCNRCSFPQRPVRRLFRITYTDDNKTVTATMPPLLPAIDMSMPIGATHCKCSLLLAWVCWHSGNKRLQLYEDDTLYRINHVPTQQMQLTLEHPGFEKSFVLAAVIIQFFEASIDEQEIHPFYQGKLDTFDTLYCHLVTPQFLIHNS